MFFDLSGAAYSHARAGDPVAKVLTPLALLALLAASWWLRPASRVLPGAKRADSVNSLAGAGLASARGGMAPGDA
jgi:hypothetical protein